jgi:hypothetical protein
MMMEETTYRLAIFIALGVQCRGCSTYILLINLSFDGAAKGIHVKAFKSWMTPSLMR